jgi:hypothetical protein
MNEEVVFWKWISPETLGIVTETSVHHWELNSEGPPVKVRLILTLLSYSTRRTDRKRAES